VENYFNYFTEIEEHYRRCRSADTATHPRMLLSPVDWALIESWKEAGIPLEAVQAGIDAFAQSVSDGEHLERMGAFVNRKRK